MDIATRIAGLPLEIRGYGPVKASNAFKANEKEKTLWEEFNTIDGLKKRVSVQ